MEEEKIYLFTTEWCYACPEAKKYVKDNKLDVEIIEIEKKDGTKDEESFDLAIGYGIRGVPTFVVETPNLRPKVLSFEEFKKRNEE